MIFPCGRPNGRLLKSFASLGPYIREEKCDEHHFFFDCLAVCVNINSAPEEREFYGWWLDLELENYCFVYQYHSGLFNQHGEWKPILINDTENKQKLEETKHNFHQRLKVLLEEMKMALEPAILMSLF